MTNAELARIVRLPGKVYMPILAAGDVVHIAVEKAGLLDKLSGLCPNDKAAWSIYANNRDGIVLDVA